MQCMLDAITDGSLFWAHVKSAIGRPNVYHGDHCLWCTVGMYRRSLHRGAIRPYPNGRDLSSNNSTRALIVGIEYHGALALAGTRNDVDAVRTMLRTYAHVDNQRIIVDNAATYTTILDGLGWLVAGAVAGDRLYFHYSGHGAQLPDTNRDEPDGLDEVLVPIDYHSAGYITDDLLYSNVVAKIPDGVTLYCTIDACHSGTVFDLPNTYRIQNGQTVVTKQAVFNRGTVVALSATVDRGVAKETRGRGVFTAALQTILQQTRGKITLSKMLRRLANSTASQIPVLSSTENVTLTTQFFWL